MNNLATLSTQDDSVKMTSLDLLSVINSFREEEGKPAMRHDNFMRKIRDEFDEEALLNFEGSYQGVDNATTICYLLPRDECMIMAMRESKGVRRKTVDYIKTLEESKPALPNFSNPAEAARAWAEQYEKSQMLLEENKQIKDYTVRQTKYIGVLEDQHAKGITCAQFAKELNGVNVQQVQNYLSSEKNWMRKDKGGWNATAYTRDKYLSVKFVEGHDGISRPTCYLTIKGATLLYRYYCREELPMKKTWDGNLTPKKYLPIIGEEE